MRPVLIINPTTDQPFAEHVWSLLDDASTPGSVQAALRERYPDAVVRPREISAERHVVWYVYRDGRWVPSLPRPEGARRDER